LHDLQSRFAMLAHINENKSCLSLNKQTIHQ
jgi:hypothetical protein